MRYCQPMVQRSTFTSYPVSYKSSARPCEQCHIRMSPFPCCWFCCVLDRRYREWHKGAICLKTWGHRHAKGVVTRLLDSHLCFHRSPIHDTFVGRRFLIVEIYIDDLRQIRHRIRCISEHGFRTRGRFRTWTLTRSSHLFFYPPLS